MSTKTFKQYLVDYGIDDIEIIESDQSTHTAEEAATVHGVPVSNIVKSLVVTDDIEHFMFLVPGDKQLNLDKASEEIEDEARMAIADEIKSITGFSIGGVPPFGHKKELRTFVVKGFDTDQELVAAAGSSNSVFKISYDRLLQITKAREI